MQTRRQLAGYAHRYCRVCLKARGCRDTGTLPGMPKTYCRVGAKTLPGTPKHPRMPDMLGNCRVCAKRIAGYVREHCRVRRGARGHGQVDLLGMCRNIAGYVKVCRCRQVAGLCTDILPGTLESLGHGQVFLLGQWKTLPGTFQWPRTLCLESLPGKYENIAGYAPQV